MRPRKILSQTPSAIKQRQRRTGGYYDEQSARQFREKVIDVANLLVKRFDLDAPFVKDDSIYQRTFTGLSFRSPYSIPSGKEPDSFKQYLIWK